MLVIMADEEDDDASTMTSTTKKGTIANVDNSITTDIVWVVEEARLLILPYFSTLH